VQTTNGDGFGIGWYDELALPGLYKHTQPAWNDANLHDLCSHTQSHMFLAHVRAATGTAVQHSNCHPFRFENWLFVHNGRIREARKLRHRLATEIDHLLFPEITGTTDTELMFYLALHFGMDNEPYDGIARMVGFVERLGQEMGVEYPMQMTLGVADGKRLFACRYSSERKSRTLYHSADISTIRHLVPPERQSHLDRAGEMARTVVSEPFSDLPGLWEEIPESTFVTIDDGKVELREFVPRTI
jgi:glutamine amidotransferase